MADLLAETRHRYEVVLGEQVRMEAMLRDHEVMAHGHDLFRENNDRADAFVVEAHLNEPGVLGAGRLRRIVGNMYNLRPRNRDQNIH